MIGKQLRQLLLIGTLTSVCLVLSRSVLRPAAGDRLATTYVFPPAVPLPGWQLLESHPLAEKTADRPAYVTGRRYRYSHNGLPLDIEMRYLDGGKLSFDIKPFIQQYTPVSLSPGQLLIRQQQGGFYGLFTYKERAYLSACMTPQNSSTVTYEQYNRIIYSVEFSRLLPQLLIHERLLDRRCLWAHLSIPTQQPSESAYLTLEEAWLAWYQWWSPRFPKP